MAQLLRYLDTSPEVQDAVVKHALSHRVLAVEPQGVADMMLPTGLETHVRTNLA